MVIFGSFDICDGGGAFLLSYYFLKNEYTMSTPSCLSKNVNDIETYYSFDEHIIHFRSEVKVSSLEDEYRVILEACLP